MQPVESYCVYLSLYPLGYPLLPASGLAAGLLLPLALLAHLALEQPRWQLIPLYAIDAFILYSILIDSAAQWPAGWLFLLATSALLMATAALACLFPVAKFPELTGRFRSVGIITRYLDTKAIPGAKTFIRADSGVQTPQRYPRIGVTVFYPSGVEASKKTGAPFLSKAIIRGLSEFLHMPAALFSYLTLGRLRAVPELPLVPAGIPMAPSKATGTASTGAAGPSATSPVPAKLPVLLLSHGLGGVAGMYACQATELASQGFVVFALTHNDGSACLAEFPDDPKSNIRLTPVPAYGSQAMRQLRADQLRTRAAEVSFLLDYIYDAEAKHEAGEGSAWGAGIHVPFAGRLDLAHGVGVVGHSFGAATAVLATHQDERIRTAVAHDCWLLPLPAELVRSGLQRAPLLLTQSRKWTEWSEQNVQVVQFTQKCRDAILIDFPGTAHSNYSDVPLFSQLLARRLGQIGTADFRQAMRDINHAQSEFVLSRLTDAGTAAAHTRNMHASNGSNGHVSNGKVADTVTPAAGQTAKQQFEQLLSSKRATLLARSGDSS